MYIRYSRILDRVYKEEGVLENLSKLLGTQLKRDWIGRIYTVINPYVQDGKYNPEAFITELGSDLPSEMVVEKYIMERLAAAQSFIRANNLFDLLSYNIERIDEYENYLFTMYPIPYYDMMKWTKILSAVLGGILIVGVILLIIF